jgi:uncharacterized OB-fold protein
MIELMPAQDELFAAAREHRFVLPRCAACGEFRFPPRLRCPHCGQTRTEWVAASGRGTVYSFVVVHQRLHPAFDANLPYAVALVQLEEGPRMLAMLIESDPAEVRVDAPVEVVFQTLDDELVIPRVRTVRV